MIRCCGLNCRVGSTFGVALAVKNGNGHGVRKTVSIGNGQCLKNSWGWCIARMFKNGQYTRGYCFKEIRFHRPNRQLKPVAWPVGTDQGDHKSVIWEYDISRPEHDHLRIDIRGSHFRRCSFLVRSIKYPPISNHPLPKRIHTAELLLPLQI
jgi:hypothetical protein